MSNIRLLNKYEELTYDKLHEVCREVGAHVFPKVRLADVFKIGGSGIDDEKYSYSLKSHFDFLVTDSDYKPLFSVEFDGPLHLTSEIQAKRDALKNAICGHFNHPILRINSNYINREYRGLDLLTYFVDVWFLEEAFYEAQKTGTVPYDEPFDPASIYSSGINSDKKWPYWLSLDIQIKLQKLYEEEMTDQMVPSHHVGIDKKGDYRCMSWLALPHKKAIYIKTGMRSQQYPAVSESDLLSMLSIFDIYQKLTEYFEDRHEVSVSRQELCEKVSIFKESFEMRGASSCSVRDQQA